MKKSFYLNIILAFICCHSLFAQATQDSTLRAYTLNDITITALATERSFLKTPITIERLSYVDIQRDQELHIAPVLNRTPGIYMHSSNLNTNRLTIRGMGARTFFGTSKVRAFWNGIPLSSGEGTTDIEDIDLSLLDEIEVLKGPSSSLYGAGLGGALLLKSRPIFTTSNEMNLQQGVTLGAFGMRRSITQLQRSNKKWFSKVSYAHTTWDGYRENNEYERSQFTGLSVLKPSTKHTIHLLVSHIQLDASIPSSLNEEMFMNTPTAAAPNWLASRGYENYNKWLGGISHQWEIQTKTQLQTTLFGQFRKNDEVRPFNILDEEQLWLGIRTQLTHQFNDSFSTEWGFELFDDDYEWQTFQNENRIRGNQLSQNIQDRSFFNAFGRIKWNWTPQLSLHAGLNLNRTLYQNLDLNTDQQLERSFPLIISPRVALNYLTDTNLSLFITASHGFSPPTVEESLTPDGQLNPSIQPEQGWSFEGGIKGLFDQGKLRYQISLYSMEIQDLLVSRRSSEDAFIGINAGKTLHQGVEIAINYSKNLLPKLQVHTFANYSKNWHEFLDFIDGENDFSGNELTGVPSQQANVGLDINHEAGFTANITSTHIGTIPITDDNSIYSTAYTVFNAKIGYNLPIHSNWKFPVEIGLQNVFNEKYASQILVNASSFGGAAPRYYYPGLPRNLFIRASISYQF